MNFIVNLFGLDEPIGFSGPFGFLITLLLAPIILTFGFALMVGAVGLPFALFDAIWRWDFTPGHILFILWGFISIWIMEKIN